MTFQSVGQDTLAEQPLRIHQRILQRRNLGDRKGTEIDHDCCAWGWRTVLAMGGGGSAAGRVEGLSHLSRFAVGGLHV